MLASNGLIVSKGDGRTEGDAGERSGSGSFSNSIEGWPVPAVTHSKGQKRLRVGIASGNRTTSLRDSS
jgi:hypothetical protein